MSVEKAEFLVDDCLYTQAADSFGLCQHRFVVLFLCCAFGFLINVHAESLLPDHFHGFRDTYCRIIIEVQGTTPSGDRAAAQSHFHSFQDVVFEGCKFLIILL